MPMYVTQGHKSGHKLLQSQYDTFFPLLSEYGKAGVYFCLDYLDELYQFLWLL